MRRLLKRRWVFALGGALLILVSTFASGYVVDRQDRRAKDAQEGARESQVLYEQSVAKYDSAFFKMALSQITDDVGFTVAYTTNFSQVGNGTFQSPENQQTSTRMLYSAAEDLLVASGTNADEDAIARVQEAHDKAFNDDPNDDPSAISFLSDTVAPLIGSAKANQTELYQYRSAFEQDAQSAEQFSQRARLFAIAAQLVGLLLLVFKEVPEASKS